MKIVINDCFGGFGLSHEGAMLYLKKLGKEPFLEYGEFSRLCGPTYWLVPEDQRNDILDSSEFHNASLEDRQASNKAYGEKTFNPRDLKRNDTILIAVIEELGEKANFDHSHLKIVEIPDGVDWEIAEYDGNEHIAEKHRTWS